MTKTWLITGTSSGIGRQLTEMLLERGDRVAATVRRLDALDGLKARFADRLWVAPLEVTDLSAVRAVIGRAFAELRRIDVVVSNAGYGLFGAAEEVDDSQIRRQIETNLIGSIGLIRAALPHLRAQGGGRVLQVSSEGGQVTYPCFSIYHAAKWGIEGFVEAVAQEMKPFGIDFTIIEPGPAGTNFGASLDKAPPMGAYEATPAGDIRRAVASGGFPIRGDAKKMARAIIDCADGAAAPMRLTLGMGAYERVHAALSARLAALEAQRSVAISTEADH